MIARKQRDTLQLELVLLKSLLRVGVGGGGFQAQQDGVEQSVTVLPSVDNYRLLTWLQETAK